MDSPHSSISDNFKAARKQLGVTQIEMAELLEIDRSYLSRIENDKAEPSLKLIRYMERLLTGMGRVKSRLSDEDKSTVSSHSTGDAEAVAEFLARYGEKPVEARGSDSDVIFDPKWREGDSKPPVTVSAVLDHLKPWLDAAAQDPNIAPVMLHVLRKHLPHSDLEEDPD